MPSEAPPTRFRVRYRLSVAGGAAIEEVDGLYISIEEHEHWIARLRRDNAPRLSEAERLLRVIDARHPLPATDSQRRDVHHWLALCP